MKWTGTLVSIITSICIIMDAINDNMAIVYKSSNHIQIDKSYKC